MAGNAPAPEEEGPPLSELESLVDTLEKGDLSLEDSLKTFERGVKLIGATAHFVTADLDEGPIIEQAVERVDHRASVEDMIRIGRDIEAQVLARSVKWIGERRLLLNGMRTVVFR